MKKMKIYLAGDHAGLNSKKKIKVHLQKQGYEVEDLGPHEYNKKDDYPDFVIPLAKKVSQDKKSKGIIIAGSGQGEAIIANKIKGIRAAVYHGKNIKFLKLSREHNNANVLCLGARFLNEKEMKTAVKVWLETKFQEGRHLRRLKKFDKYGSRI